MSIIIRLQNLPLEANSLDIRRFFQSLHIPDGGVHIVGGDQGDAFIAFGSDEDARQAMGRDGNLIKGSRIKLLLSSRNEMQRVIDAARNQSMSMISNQAPISQPPPQQSSVIQNVGLPSKPSPQIPHQFQQQYASQSGSIPMNQQQLTLSSQINSSSGSGYYQQNNPSNGPPPYGMINNQSNDHQSNYRRPSPSVGFRSRSRSRSRSPPRNRFMEQTLSSQSNNPNSNSSMHSGLLGSLPPASLPQQMSSYSQQNSGLYNNSHSNTNMHHPNSVFEPPRDQSSYEYGNRSSSSYHPTPASNNNMNDMIGGNNKYPPEQHDRWNQSSSSNIIDSGYRAPGPSCDDMYRKMDSIHQQPPPSSQQHQQQQQQMNNNLYGTTIPPSGFNNQYNNESLIQQQAPPSQCFPSNRMFTLQLYDLPFNVRNDDLIKFFHPLYLNEDNIKIFYDEKGFPTGIALVRFSTPREFESALSYNNRYLGDRQIQIRPLEEINGPSTNITNSVPQITQQIQQQQQPPPIQQPNPLMPTPNNNQYSDPYRSENYPPYRNTPEDIAGYNRQYMDSQLQLPPRSKELVLYMKGLPYSNCTKKDVAEFFEPINLVNIEIEMDSRGKPTGNAFVEFRNNQDFDRGMEYNMRHMGRRYIELIPLLMFEKYGPNYHMPSAPPPPKHGRPGNGPPYGNHPPITYCVSVRGLSKHVTSKDLKSYFAKVNAETYAVHIMLTTDRMNAGEAFLEFISKENQRRALERNGDYIGHDRITVRHVPYDVVRNAVQQPPPGQTPPHHHQGGGLPGHRGGPSDYPFGRDSKPPRNNFDKYRNDRLGSKRGPPRNDAPPFYDKATILIAKNISSKASDEDLCALFADYYITPSRVKRRQGSEDGKDQTQEAQISFHCKADAEHAQRNMDKKYFLDRKIQLTFA